MQNRSSPSSESALGDATAASLSSTIGKDFLASIVVFLVALPLCMGIAIASGAPEDKAASVGIITGIVGGILVGAIGGSPLQVSGPAAGLSVMVAQLASTHGWQSVGLIVALGGFMQLIGGLCRLGQWFRAVSPAVIHGMLAGIGILILASQFQIMLDHKPLPSGLANLMALPHSFMEGVIPSSDSTADDAARIGFLAILIILLWKPCTPKSLHIVPPALVAVIVATVVSIAASIPITKVAIPDSLTDAITWPTSGIPENFAGWRSLLISAFSLALIASAETLLCATAVDAMHSGERTNYDREMAAQGVGNLICGLLGALPMTGVIVRSSANVEAGAKTRLSTILHGMWLLGCVLVIPFALRDIPRASLAAILVITGYKLVNPKMIKSLYQLGRGEIFIYLITVITIVTTDLLTGVVAGIVAAALKLFYVFSRLIVSVDYQPNGDRTILHLVGTATFVSLPRLAAVLEAIPPTTELHVDFTKLDYIDHACLDLLGAWEKQHSITGGRLIIDWDELTTRFHRGVTEDAAASA